jgi:AmmeMemoRadiSam system protein A
MTSLGKGFWMAALVCLGCTCEKGADEHKNATDDHSLKSGYGSTVDLRDFELNQKERLALLRLARQSVQTWVQEKRMLEATQEHGAHIPKLQKHRACFVTIKKNGQLRGCIGSLEPRRSLLEDVRQNAVAASTQDTRFSPVQKSELEELTYSISVLDLPRPLQGVSIEELPSYLEKQRLGVIIELGGRRSTFLPSVWEDLPDPLDFLSRLCMKQGASADCWKRAEAVIRVYGSIYFSED